MLDTVLDHRLARLVERHPRLLEDIAGRCAAVRIVVPLAFEAVSPPEATRVARRIAAGTGVGVDTVANHCTRAARGRAMRPPPV